MISKLINLILLASVYAGVQHFSHHNCIAIATVCALVYLKRKEDKAAQQFNSSML